MANEVVASPQFTRDNTQFRYYIGSGGNIMRKDRKSGEVSIVVANAFTPEKQYFYFLTGTNVTRTVRVPRKKKTDAPAAAEPTAAA